MKKSKWKYSNYRKRVAIIIKIGEQQIKDGKISEEKEWRKLFVRK